MDTANKVYKPEVIQDTPFFGSSAASSQKSNGQVFYPDTIPNNSFPQSIIARDIKSVSIDSTARKILGSYSFGRMGAIQIGNYQSGVSGDVRISPSGIVARDSAGNNTFALDATTGDAVFKGTVAAGSVVTGYLEVGGAAGDVNSGTTTISGGKITASSITADRLSVSSLSAIAADLGTVTAGSITGVTITGGTVRTASSGARVQLNGSNNQLEIYNSSGSVVGNMRYYSGGGYDNIIIEAGSNKQIILSASNYVQVFDCDLHVDGQITAGGDVGINGHNMNGVNIVYLNGHALTNGSSSGKISIDGTDKTAIVPTSMGYRALYCIESPEVWFMDFCPGMSELDIDPLFLEVTEGEMKFIKVEGGGFQVWRKRRAHAHKRFEPKTLEDFYKNEVFLGLAKG